MKISVYEFECPKCDSVFLRELASLTDCPSCKEEMNLSHIVILDTDSELIRSMLERPKEKEGEGNEI